jgi:hypothetical protein
MTELEEATRDLCKLARNYFRAAGQAERGRYIHSMTTDPPWVALRAKGQEMLENAALLEGRAESERSFLDALRRVERLLEPES